MVMDALRTGRRLIGGLLTLLVFVAACGGGDAWQDAYRAKLDDLAAESTDDETSELGCAVLAELSDEELREFALTVGLSEEASDLDSVLESEGVEPTDEIYDEAAGIFTDWVIRFCE